MKAQRFEIGQAVAVKFNHGYPLVPENPSPSMGDVCHVSGYHDIGRLHWYIGLMEFPSEIVFVEDAFDAVITDSELETLLNEVPQTVEV